MARPLHHYRAVHGRGRLGGGVGQWRWPSTWTRENADVQMELKLTVVPCQEVEYFS